MAAKINPQSISVLADVAAAKVSDFPIEVQIRIYRALAETLPDERECQKAAETAKALSHAAALQLQFQTLRNQKTVADMLMGDGHGKGAQS